MTDRNALHRLIASATISGDVETLAALAIELTNHLASAEGALAQLQAADESRRAGTRDRKRRSRGTLAQPSPTPVSSEVGHALSRDVTGQSVTESDGTRPLPPSSPSFPTPHITTPSPIPASASSASEGGDLTDDEREFFAECDSPALAAVASKFLAGKSATARNAWIGRFRGAMGLPPHPTAQELADALGDLMTEPPEKWVPALFRVYAGRIRRDAAREAERNTAATTPRSFTRAGDASPYLVAEATTLWARYKAAGLLARTGPEVLQGRGEQLVADGHYPDLAAFRAEIAITKPWELAEARTDGWGINELAKRLQAPRKAAS